MTVIGKSIQRIDALGKVTGKALFPGDINLPNQAYMKVLFASVGFTNSIFVVFKYIYLSI